jgi:hypothetical protein
MRRIATGLVLSAFLSTSAFAQDPAPDAEARSAFRQPGGLMDRSDQVRKQQLSFFLGIPWYALGVGVGARYYIPIMHNGFLPTVNDEFGIEFGADAAFGFAYGFGFLLDIPVEVSWQFHFTQDFSAYAKLGIALEFDITRYRCYGSVFGGCSLVWVNPISTVGIFYKLNETISLRAEVGYPWLKVGIGIAL